MAATSGLRLLLETPTARRPAAPAQIISKAAVNAAGATGKNDVNDTSSSAFAFSCSSSAASRAPVMPVPAASSFLQRCFLCHRELADGRDIYIYRGDRPFCSEECRCRHILLVEDDDDDDCARVAAADRTRRRRRRQAVAGGFAF